MDVLNEYDGLVNGEPLRIKKEDLEELNTAITMIPYIPWINFSGSQTDVMNISAVVRDLVVYHNSLTSHHERLRMVIQKILDYNK